MTIGKGKEFSMSICFIHGTLQSVTVVSSGKHRRIQTTSCLWQLQDGLPASVKEPLLGNSLSPEQRLMLKNMLTQYSEVIQGKPGRMTWTEHSIITTDTLPVRLPPYWLPYAYQDAVKAEIEEMLKHGVIEESHSEWSAPIVSCEEKRWHFMIMYGLLLAEQYVSDGCIPMPWIDELIDRLGRANFISTMDLNWGYWQVSMAEEAKAKTAFVTPFGHFHFNVKPFGLQGAPATFQKSMDHVIQARTAGLRSSLPGWIIYFSICWTDHLKHLSTVLQQLGEVGLSVKPTKCQLGMKECVLGHVVGYGNVKPDPGKIEAVRQFSTPRTKKQVRAFLGLAGYYRWFIPNFSAMASPLTDLTKKTANTSKLKWTAECTKASSNWRMLCVQIQY